MQRACGSAPRKWHIEELDEEQKQIETAMEDTPAYSQSPRSGGAVGQQKDNKGPPLGYAKTS